MIKVERDHSKVTIRFDCYTITYDEWYVTETITVECDLAKVNEIIDGKERRWVVPVLESVSAEYGERKFVLYIPFRDERILIDCIHPEWSTYVVMDRNGNIELHSASGLGFVRKYKAIYKEENEMSNCINNNDDKSFIKKEVFIIMNDRIFMYHLPFHGQVIEYLLKSDAVSQQILVCCDYARIKGSIMEQTFDGLSIDGKPLPVEAGHECHVIGSLESSAYDTVQQIYIVGSDGKEFFIDTYSEDIGIGAKDGSGCHIKLKDPVTKEIKDFHVNYAFSVSGKRFIYQSAN